ncbi:MAG: hypothetical protein ACRER3_23485 [Pseudomonas fluorescens]
MKMTDQTNNIRETAKTLYMTTPATMSEVAREVDCSERTIKRWSAADDGWKKITGRQISAKAQETADRIATAVSGLDSKTTQQQLGTVLGEVRVEVAIEERATLLAWHRTQLRVVDDLLDDAIKARDDGAARLAWRVAQTLAIKQRAERLAWGLDGMETDMVIIERH